MSSPHQHRQNDHQPIQAHVTTDQPHVICQAFRSIPKRTELKTAQGRSSEFSLRPDVRQPVHHLELIGFSVRSFGSLCKFQGAVFILFIYFCLHYQQTLLQTHRKSAVKIPVSEPTRSLGPAPRTEGHVTVWTWNSKGMQSSGNFRAVLRVRTELWRKGTHLLDC